MKKFLALLLAVVMVLSMTACGNKPGDAAVTTTAAVHTYHTYATALATNWNPHTWEMNSDSAVMAYIETPLVDMTIKDSETGEYQWIFQAANDIVDVTAANQGDLTKYGCDLPAGMTADQITEGYVYEIKLNPEMCWQDGTPINADTYIYSMQQLLDPSMKNYRANNYWSGESALAGALGYYNSGSTVFSIPNSADGATMTYAVADLVKGEDGVYTTPNGDAVAFGLTTGYAWMGGNSLADYQGAGYIPAEGCWDVLSAAADADGFVPVTDETMAALLVFTSSDVWGNETADQLGYYMTAAYSYPVVGFDTVGLYKVDEYTIRYVCQASYDYYYFLTSCTSNWIVHKDTYEASKDTTGKLVTTAYGTAPENTMSYGPYKLVSLQDAKQMVFERNEKYFEYDVAADGTITSTTSFTVNGENVAQWQMDKIVIDVMTDDAAKQAFLKGEIDDWTPSAEETVKYSTSTQLYKVDETYTMRLFFNCDLENLKTMDESYGNTNSVVLSNVNFRKALSLAIDRNEWVSATAGYKPAFSLINSLYFYDVYEDPSSIYRNTDEAMGAVVGLYDVAYGEGTPYADLKAAHDSVTGYNLTEAKNLMAKACDELVAAGLYTEGDPIHIRIGYKAGTLDSTDQQQLALFNKFINAAAEGSGFGAITLEGVGDLNNRYASVANGEFAIGYGAWGGAAFYPFTMFRVYMDPTYVDPIHESGCFDPATETVTLNILGEDVTMTWQEWSVSMTGTGPYANSDNETKLAVLAAIEEAYLERYYCIPIATSTSCSMLSYKLSYFTENYNIMYGFGDLRLIQPNYNDAEWTEYVASVGGTLSYE